MELEKIDINGLNDIYTLNVVKKEFTKAVNEQLKINPPWKRYQKKLIQDLVVLDMEKERAIDLPQYEKLSAEKDLYSIRHPETKKNVRIISTITEGIVVVLVAFLEKNEGDYQKAINLARQRVHWLNS